MSTEEDSLLLGLHSKLQHDSSGSRIGDSSSIARGHQYETLSDRFLSRLSSRERTHALHTLGVGPAAHLIRDAVLGEKSTEEWFDPYQNPHQPLRNILSLLCSRLIAHRWMNRLLRATAWILVLLSFIEPPSWCQNSDLPIVHNTASTDATTIHHDQEFGTCGILLHARGTAVDGTENVQLYPNSSSMWVTPPQAHRIEAWCLAILLFFLVLQFGKDGMEWKHFFHAGSGARQLHSLQLILLMLLMTALYIPDTTYSPFFRLVLLGTHVKTFQKELDSLVRMVRVIPPPQLPVESESNH